MYFANSKMKESNKTNTEYNSSSEESSIESDDYEIDDNDYYAIEKSYGEKWREMTIDEKYETVEFYMNILNSPQPSIYFVSGLDEYYITPSELDKQSFKDIMNLMSIATLN
jgi:hypothetical protein